MTATAISSIDLHIHTHFSDGKYAPSEIVRYAAARGLRTLAISDHDNTRGVAEAQAAAAPLGLEVIPAIEFTCRWPACQTPPAGGDVDVLGYFIALDDPAFRAFEQATLDDIHARITDCCASVTAAGYAVTLADLFAENPRYAGLVHLGQVLTRKGYIPHERDAPALVLEHWQRVRLSRFTIQDVIETIHHAGGVAVLAHPAAIECSGQWPTAAQIGELVAMGLDGLEIYHYRLDEAARAYFLALAARFDLLISGGADFHGWFEGLDSLGSQPVTPEMLAQLRARHTLRKKP